MMKKLLKQVGISLCFIALFVGLQIGSQFALGYGYLFYGKLAGWQMSAKEISDAANTFLSANTELFTLISGCATILIVWLFSVVRKKKFVQECNLVPFDVKNFLPIVLIAIGCTLAISGVLSFLPENLMNSYNNHMGSTMERNNIEGIVLMILSTSIVVPISEELIFRGVIMPRLNIAMNIVPASILTALAFGILHGNVVQIIYAFVLGLVMCFIAVRCNSLWASCLFHIIVNTIGNFHFIENFIGDSLMTNVIASVIGLLIVIATIFWLCKINEVKCNTTTLT